MARDNNGKTETLNAEAAARAVLSGAAAAVPRSAVGTVEMIRQIRILRDTARKGRAAAIVTLKALIVTAPAELREQVDGCTDKVLIDRCASLRPRCREYPPLHPRSTRCARWRNDGRCSTPRSPRATRSSRSSPRQHAPTLRQGFGIGADTAAEVLIVLGDNPERVRSEAAFAKLCGACPYARIVGQDQRASPLRRRSPPGHAAFYRAVLVRMRFHQPTIEYVKRRTAEGLSKRYIIRCLKRFLAREVYQRAMTDHPGSTRRRPCWRQRSSMMSSLSWRRPCRHRHGRSGRRMRRSRGWSAGRLVDAERFVFMWRRGRAPSLCVRRRHLTADRSLERACDPVT